MSLSTNLNSFHNCITEPMPRRTAEGFIACGTVTVITGTYLLFNGRPSGIFLSALGGAMILKGKHDIRKINQAIERAKQEAEARAAARQYRRANHGAAEDAAVLIGGISVLVVAFIALAVIIAICKRR